MISVILPTRDDETALAYALAALVPAAADGTIREVIVVDLGSTDGTAAVADAAGCRFVAARGPLGAELASAADSARSDWLLFISPRVVLEPSWQREAQEFIDRTLMAGGGRRLRAAAFRHARAGYGWRERMGEFGAALRARLLFAPYHEEGLLVPRRLYREVGGHRALPAFVDADLARRIGRSRLTFLRARAVLSGEAADAPRGAKAFVRLVLFALRVPPRLFGRLAA
ncbi:glycosyltransferase [Prosthecomicrobium pneumaticum]|uniref:Glycosyltransferase involved in cell wall biosynthesis n=1 Tax=Prosthecomicrobium pneumaticum TaxID=81895 RepID=A0A7W9CU66_9HYPH|nr:glycosyltransferase [Prosthecomicrobium pneumaticum]MBB5751972.1 glycosyltransferase involved in cell wall biosynthesis [Prosthecomicrobium pneumaticum]